MIRLATPAALTHGDRALGARLRGVLTRRTAVARTLECAARAMSPAYRLAVLALILWRPTRLRGLRALAAGVIAAMAAKRLRDEVSRPRPGQRDGGGWPSRHAAAAVAVASVVAERRPAIGVPLAVATGVGLLGRVSTGDHDPADLVAGAVLGRLVARLVLAGRQANARTAAADEPGAARG